MALYAHNGFCSRSKGAKEGSKEAGNVSFSYSDPSPFSGQPYSSSRIHHQTVNDQTTPSLCSHGLLHQLRWMNVKAVCFLLSHMIKAASMRMLRTVNFITGVQDDSSQWILNTTAAMRVLRGVTWKHCQFCSCCVCAGLRTTWFWQEAWSRGSLAVGGEGIVT